MNVLHVNMSLDPVNGGGTAERVRQIHTCIQSMEGVSSRILTLDIGDVKTVPGYEDVVLLPCWNRRWYIPAPRLFTLLREVRRADVVHLMNHWTILNAIVYWLVCLLHKPYVVCPAGALQLFGRSKLPKRCYNFLVGRSLVAHADAAIAVAAGETTVLQQYGVPSERIYHIPNGVSIRDFSYKDASMFRSHVGLNADDSYLLFVGRLNVIKGPDLLLRAFAEVAGEFPDIHLVFSGPDGGMREELERIVGISALQDRVHFAGYVGGEMKSSAYHGATILAVPSRQEAMSIVALEGSVCGVPVILTDRCGFDDLAKAGAAKLAKANAGSIAAAIRWLMTDRERRRTMGNIGRGFALHDYTWEIAAVRHIRIFQALQKAQV